MTLLILILIAIPVCILTILLWIYNDYKKVQKTELLLDFIVFGFTCHYTSSIHRQKLLCKL